MYAYWTGSTWSIETVTNNGTLACQIALDSSGNPHIAYSSTHPSDPWHYRNVEYASRTETETPTPFSTLLAIAVSAVVIGIVAIGVAGYLYYKRRK
jgi:hypothetical protein